MITSRYIQPGDFEILSKSLENDEYHKGMDPMFFVEQGTITLVYEDDKGPVLFARGKTIEDGDIKFIQLDIQYVSNVDGKRNLKVMLQGFPGLAKLAKAYGFHHIDFESQSPLLRKFCMKRLGFVPSVDNWLRILL